MKERRGEKGQGRKGVCASDRSADLQSAVSRVCNPQSARPCSHARLSKPADCKSAIRQITNLRYDWPRAPFPLFPFSPLLLFLLLFTLTARAHGPFDNSSHLIVSDDALELSVTMGMDGSRQFLLNAGLSEAEATTALTVRGPSSTSPLSVDLAPKFFEVNADGKILAARSVSVMTDGLEANFILTYPRPASGGLALRALYFNGIEAMRPGSFIATDENRNGLGAAKLTRANPGVEIKLPGSATALVAAVEIEKPEPVMLPATNPAPVAPTTPVPPARRIPFVLVAALVLGVGLLAAAWRLGRRS